MISSADVVNKLKKATPFDTDKVYKEFELLISPDFPWQWSDLVYVVTNLSDKDRKMLLLASLTPRLNALPQEYFKVKQQPEEGWNPLQLFSLALSRSHHFPPKLEERPGSEAAGDFSVEKWDAWKSSIEHWMKLMSEVHKNPDPKLATAWLNTLPTPSNTARRNSMLTWPPRT